MKGYTKPVAQSRFAPLDALMPLFREQFDAGCNVRFSPQGTSMLPMLRQGIDSVVLSPISGHLIKYDLPLYRRDDGHYVLHRIIESGETYTCMGDNEFAPEPGLRHSQMIAIVTSFRRGGRDYSVNHPGYKLYCRFWHHSRNARHFVLRLTSWLKRHL